MRVAFIDWFCDPARPGASGLSDLVWGMALGLSESNVDVHVIAPYSHAPAGIGETHAVTIHKQKTPRVGYRNIIGNLMLAYWAREAIEAIGHVDIIHAVEYTSTGIILALDNQKMPVVLTTPGNIYERTNRVNHFDWTVTLTYKWAAKISARRASAIIATSQSMREWWEFTGTPRERIAQIPFGVDTGKFAPDTSARNALGMDANPVVLFVGRLQSENSAELLIASFPLVLQQNPECRLHIVGNGPDKRHLVRLAMDLGIDRSITWHGAVPFSELPLFYAAADIFVCPRISRVTPRVLFEAMASQTPVVATELEGIVDFIEHKTTGLLFPTGDTKKLAESIIELLRDRRFALNLGMSARTYAMEHLDWQVVNKRIYDEVYTPILDTSWTE